MSNPVNLFIQPRKSPQEKVAESMVKGGLAGSLIATITLTTHQILHSPVPMAKAKTALALGATIGSSTNLIYTLLKQVWDDSRERTTNERSLF